MWHKLNVIKYSFIRDSFYLYFRFVLRYILFHNLNSIMIFYLSCNRDLIIPFLLSILCDLSLTWNFLHSLSNLILHNTPFIWDIFNSTLGSRSLNSWLILNNTSTITRGAGFTRWRTWWARWFLHIITFIYQQKRIVYFY